MGFALGFNFSLVAKNFCHGLHGRYLVLRQLCCPERPFQDQLAEVEALYWNLGCLGFLCFLGSPGPLASTASLAFWLPVFFFPGLHGFPGFLGSPGFLGFSCLLGSWIPCLLRLPRLPWPSCKLKCGESSARTEVQRERRRCLR